MADDDAKVVHVEKIEHPGDNEVEIAAKAITVVGIPFIDTGSTEYVVTLDDGRVGHGSTQEEAIEDAYEQ